MKLRLLRGHGLIAKVSKTHRYVVTEKERRIITALLAARQPSTEKLTAQLLRNLRKRRKLLSIAMRKAQGRSTLRPCG